MTMAIAQCMASSVGFRTISVNVRQYRTASSRVSGVRGGFVCCAGNRDGHELLRPHAVIM